MSNNLSHSHPFPCAEIHEIGLGQYTMEAQYDPIPYLHPELMFASELILRWPMKHSSVSPFCPCWKVHSHYHPLLLRMMMMYQQQLHHKTHPSLLCPQAHYWQLKHQKVLNEQPW
uniref:Lipid binding protein n=1 Tax=Rhizophora mucronata TaxID=61149 RepID=A0A2P2LG08_RHIMU